jgi:hypothetical protein
MLASPPTEGEQMSDDKFDDADAIELAESLRTAAAATRQMFNAFLHEGFTETQALQLVRSWLHATAGGPHA